MDEDAPVPISQSRHDRYIVAHAVFGSVAALITMPIAILAGRYLRNWRYWNILHIVANGLTVIFIVVSFALGNAALEPTPGEYTGSDTDSHHQLGLAVFIIVVVQALGGIGAKFTRTPDHNYVTVRKGRSVVRYIHILFGLVTAGLLYAQVNSGFDEWDETSDSQTTTPRGIRIAFCILLGIEVALYVVGWPIMEYQGRRKMEREIGSGGVNGEKKGASSAQLVA